MRILSRESDTDAKIPATLGLNLDRAAQRGDDLTAERKPQPAVPAALGSRFVAAPEALKNAAGLIARNMASTVADSHMQRLSVACGVDADFTVAVAMLHGVVHEIVNNQPKLLAIGSQL